VLYGTGYKRLIIMKNFLSVLVLIFLSSTLFAVENVEISEDQCRAASTEIIKISKEALTKTDSKKNIAKLKKRIDDWSARLKSDENACNLYQSILKSSTSF